MKAIDFPAQNIVFAENQPEYQRLPARVSGNEDGCTGFCYKLSWRERLVLFITGRIWIEQLTFHKPFQPIRPSVDEPDWSAYGQAKVRGEMD